MIQRISEEELSSVESLYDPVCAIECLFTDLEHDNFSDFNPKKFGHVRLYQFSMLSYEFLIDEDSRLTNKENFKRREMTGNIISFGARLYGKTLISEKTDLILDMILNSGEDIGFSSFDALHIEGVLEVIIQAFDNHPFLKMFDARVKRNPYYIYLKRNGNKVLGVNMNLQGESPGAQFFQKHFNRLYIEEASHETQEVYDKRQDSVSELGCVGEGSKIILADLTTKNIENVKIGEEILAWDENNNTIINATIENVIDRGYKDVIYVESDDGKGLWLTPEHKIRISSKGMNIYRWAEAIKCPLQNYKVQVLNYIEDYSLYLRGVLLGLIESDGSTCVRQGVTGIFTQFRIYQAKSCEYEFIRYLLNFLNISFTEKELENNRFKDKYERSLFYLFHIRTENNSKIFEWYEKLKEFKNKDIMYGFVAGFVLGDGYIEKNGGMIITQSYVKNYKKISFIKDILNSLNIGYSENIRKDNSSSNIRIQKYKIPFAIPQTKKCKNYLKKIVGIRRFFWSKKPQNIKLKGFKEKIHVYDLTTSSGNFIANGFIVHNCVMRLSGMTDFTRHQPAGKIFYNPANKQWVVNYPQYANPTWDEKAKEKAIKDRGGEDSPSFRIYVDGEIVEDFASAIDMDRVRKNYDYNRIIKHLEVKKENFQDFDTILVVERPANANVLYLCADIGESASSELIVITEVNKIYKYIYNITLYKLTDKEQFQIFKFLATRLEVNFIGLDTSEGTGRSIFHSLEEIFSKDHLIHVSFSEKIPVDFEKDDQGRVIFEDGLPVYREEYVESWSVKRLKDLLYEEGKFTLPLDYKLDNQLNSVATMQSGARTTFQCKNPDDHIFAAFRVFAIAQWMTEFVNTPKITKKTFFKSFV
jgi:hypothetical protein